MMESPPTLAGFFSLEERPLTSERLPPAEKHAKLAEVRDKIGKAAPGLAWGVASAEILRSVADLLKISFTDIMVATWNKYHVLKKYKDRTKYPPDQVSLVPLAEHTITSEHHPYVDILVGEQSVARLDFTVKVALALKGFILKIRDAKIIEIHSGNLKGKGSLACEDFVLLEEETESFPLPATISLGEGIPI